MPANATAEDRLAMNAYLLAGITEVATLPGSGSSCRATNASNPVQ
jgi:hypothetical protein